MIIASTGCPPDKQITEMVLNDDLMPIYYTPKELHACLKNVSLENHLSRMLTYAFSVQQLAELKRNLDEVTPGRRMLNYLLMRFIRDLSS